MWNSLRVENPEAQCEESPKLVSFISRNLASFLQERSENHPLPPTLAGEGKVDIWKYIQGFLLSLTMLDSREITLPKLNQVGKGKYPTQAC